MTDSNAPAVNLRPLLEEMIERNASDLHITAGEQAKLRVDAAREGMTIKLPAKSGR